MSSCAGRLHSITLFATMWTHRSCDDYKGQVEREEDDYETLAVVVVEEEVEWGGRSGRDNIDDWGERDVG